MIPRWLAFLGVLAVLSTASGSARARECAYWSAYGGSVYGGTPTLDDTFADRADVARIGGLRLTFRIDGNATWTPALLAKYDAWVEKARSRGYEILGLVLYESLPDPQSAWNVPPDANGVNPYVQKFVDVTKLLMNRYADTIKHWEIWNEPNACDSDGFAACNASPQTAGGYYIRPDVYAKLLTETWVQNHDLIVRENLHLVSAGLYAHDIGGAVYSAGDYMAAVYQQGVWDFIQSKYGRRYPWDGFGYHIYTTLNGTVSSARISSYMNGIAATRAQYNDSSGIWMTEFGWLAEWVGEGLQSTNLATEFGVLESRADVARTFVFRVDEYESWGLYRANGTPRPARDMLRARTTGCTYPVPTLPAQVTGNGAISAVSWPGDRHVEVFVTSKSGELHHASTPKSGGALTAVQKLASVAGGPLACGSSAMFWPPTKSFPEVASPKGDGSMLHAYDASRGAAPWTGLEPFGGSGLARPSTLVWPDGHAEVFALGSDKGIWRTFWDAAKAGGAGGWSGWEAHVSGTAAPKLATGVAPIVWGDGHAEIFATDEAGVAWHDWTGNFPGTWHGWEVLAAPKSGVAIASRPIPVRLGDGTVTVFARGTDDLLYVSTHAGATWSAFTAFDAATKVFGEPSATWDPHAKAAVVVTRNAYGHVLAARAGGGGGGGGGGGAMLARVGAQIAASDPFAWLRADRTLDVFAIDPGGAIASAHDDGTGKGFGAWVSVGAGLDACSAPLAVDPDAPDGGADGGANGGANGDGSGTSGGAAPGAEGSAGAGCACDVATGARSSSLLTAAALATIAAFVATMRRRRERRD
jgi:hypothetical protein